MADRSESFRHRDSRITRRRRTRAEYTAEPFDDFAGPSIVLAACRRTDLSLNDNRVDMLFAAAPYVTAMTRRLGRERNF